MVEITGGDKLDKALDRIAKKLSRASSVKIGIPAGATYLNGTSIALVAAIQEFGAPSRGIPPRPFFRATIAKHSDEWPAAIAERLKANDYDARKTLAQVGEVVAGQLQQTITELTDPPLSPVTVMLRGMRSQKRYRDLKFGKMIAEARARVEAGKTNYGASTKPLVDTGQMLGSIVSVVQTDD